MLIIFDLDDTLIDTSGSVTPVKLEQALDKMMEKGLPVNRDEALFQIIELDRTTMSAKETLSQFLSSRGLESFFEIALEVLYKELPSSCDVLPRKGAGKILQELQKNHDLALVTIGDSEFQLAKMKKAGIDSSLFSKIVISQERNKGPYYQQISKELNYSAPNVIVCGDRVNLDLLPAWNLGFSTIYMQYGRGCVKQDSSWVDYTVQELEELKEILNNF